MKYKVTVQKSMYASGVVEIEAASDGEAEELVQRQIEDGTLNKGDVLWDDPVDEEGSFEVSGDVEEAD